MFTLIISPHSFGVIGEAVSYPMMEEWQTSAVCAPQQCNTALNVHVRRVHDLAKNVGKETDAGTLTIGKLGTKLVES